MFKDNITVMVTAAVNTNVADIGDHDITVGISDVVSFIDFMAPDKDNYASSSPCNKLEVDVVKNTKCNTWNWVLGLFKLYSSEVKIQLKPAEQWGYCHTEHDGGYVNTTMCVTIDLFPYKKYRLCPCHDSHFGGQISIVPNAVEDI